jgi:hypothetical protein
VSKCLNVLIFLGLFLSKVGYASEINRAITNSNDAGAGSFRAAAEAQVDFNGFGQDGILNLNFDPNLTINLLSNVIFGSIINRPPNRLLTVDFEASTTTINGGGAQRTLEFNDHTKEVRFPSNTNLTFNNIKFLMPDGTESFDEVMTKSGNGTLTFGAGTIIAAEDGEVEYGSPRLVVNGGTFQGTGTVLGLTINTSGSFIPGYTSEPEAIGTFTSNGGTVSNVGTYKVAVSPANGLTASKWRSQNGNDIQVSNPMTVAFIPVNQAGTYVNGASAVVIDPGDVESSILDGEGNTLQGNNGDISKVFSNPTGTFIHGKQSIGYEFRFTANGNGALKIISLFITSVTDFASKNQVSTFSDALKQTTYHLQDSILDIIKNRRGLVRRCPGFMGTNPDETEQLTILKKLQASANFNALRQAATTTPNHTPKNPALPKEIFSTGIPIVALSAPSHDVWLQGLGDVVNQHTTHNNVGYKAKGAGFLAGYEWHCTCCTLLGIFGGFYKTWVDYRGSNGDAHIKRPIVGTYGSHSWKNWVFHGSFTYSRPHVEQTRKLFNSSKAHSGYRANNFFFDAGVGYHIVTASNWIYTPSLEVGMNYLRQPSYRERHVAENNLQMRRHHHTTLVTGGELNIAKVFKTEMGLVTPQFNLGYTRDTSLRGKTFKYTAAGSTTVLSAPLTKAGHNLIKAGVNVAAFVRGNWQLSAGYQASVWRKHYAHEMMLGVKKKV